MNRFPVNSLARYLSEVRKIRSLGSVPETSYYPPLSELLNTIGLSLCPKVRCVVHPKSQGAGIPDLALFSVDQIPTSGEPLPCVIPSQASEKPPSSGSLALKFCPRRSFFTVVKCVLRTLFALVVDHVEAVSRREKLRVITH